jgi:hypothetical protein
MVHVRQRGDGNYTKRFATVIMLLRGDGHLCRLCVIFRGKGRVSIAEKAAYHPDITVLWQAKAWNDTPTQLIYDDTVLLPAIKEAGVGAGAPGLEVEGLAFSDNLCAHKYFCLCLTLLTLVQGARSTCRSFEPRM